MTKAPLAVLVDLAHRGGAFFMLKVSNREQFCRASFKQYGEREIVVADLHTNSADDVDCVLRELVRRVERQTDLLADKEDERFEFVKNLTPDQRIRLGAILAQLRAFKAEVLSGVSPAALEPYLDSPRSSLNPQFLQGEPSPKEASANSLRKAARARRLAREVKA